MEPDAVLGSLRRRDEVLPDGEKLGGVVALALPASFCRAAGVERRDGVCCGRNDWGEAGFVFEVVGRWDRPDGMKLGGFFPDASLKPLSFISLPLSIGCLNSQYHWSCFEI